MRQETDDTDSGLARGPLDVLTRLKLGYNFDGKALSGLHLV